MSKLLVLDGQDFLNSQRLSTCFELNSDSIFESPNCLRLYKKKFENDWDEANFFKSAISL